MRFKYILGCVFFLNIVLNHSCILDFENDHFVHVEKIPDPQYIKNLEYSYNSTTYYPLKDTLWVDPEGYLSFNFSGAFLDRFTVDVDQKVSWRQGSETSFMIDGKKSVKGTYKLTVTQFVKSGTNSLADKMGGELAAYTATVMLVVGDLTFTPVIKSIRVEDGTVHLEWNSYNHADFQSYEIRKYETVSSSYNTYRKLAVHDRSQTSLIDSSYVGGWVDYALLVDRGGGHFYSKKYRIKFPYRPVMQLEKPAAGRARLSWQTPSFYKNIRSVRVTGLINNSRTVIADSLPGDQTSVDLDLDGMFGNFTEFTLQLFAKVDDGHMTADKHSITEIITFGQRTPPFGHILYSESEEAYYLIFSSDYYNEYPEGIYRLDKSLHTTDTLVYDYNIPNLAQSANKNQIYHLLDGKIGLLKRDPMLVTDAFSVMEFVNDSSEQNFQTGNFFYLNRGNKVVVYDYATRKILLSAPSAVSDISYDGRYFLNGSDLYTFNGKYFESLRNLSFNDIKYAHFLKNENELLIATDDKAIVYDYIQNAVRAEYPLTSGYTGSHDFNDLTMDYTRRITNGLQLLNVENGEQSVIPVHPSPYGCLVKGEYLFSKGGFALKDYRHE